MSKEKWEFFNEYNSELSADCDIEYLRERGYKIKKSYAHGIFYVYNTVERKKRNRK